MQRIFPIPSPKHLDSVLKLYTEMIDMDGTTVEEVYTKIKNIDMLTAEDYICSFIQLLIICCSYNPTQFDAYSSLFDLIFIKFADERDTMSDIVTEYFRDIYFDFPLLRVFRILDQKRLFTQDFLIKLLKRYHQYALAELDRDEKNTANQKMFLLLRIIIGNKFPQSAFVINYNLFEENDYYDVFVLMKNNRFRGNIYNLFLQCNYFSNQVEKQILEDNPDSVSSDFNNLKYEANFFPCNIFSERNTSYLHFAAYYDKKSCVQKFLDISQSKLDFLTFSFSIAGKAFNVIPMYEHVITNYRHSKVLIKWHFPGLDEDYLDIYPECISNYLLRIACKYGNLNAINFYRNKLSSVEYKENELSSRFGLSNIGSNCYINVIIKTLSALNDFKEALDTYPEEHLVLKFLSDCFNQIDRLNHSQIGKEVFWDNMYLKPSNFDINEQQDACEVLQLLIDSFPRWIKTMFTLCTVTDGFRSYKFQERYNIIPLETEANGKIEKSLDDFFSEKKIILFPYYLCLQYKRYCTTEIDQDFEKDLCIMKPSINIDLTKYSFYGENSKYYLQCIIVHLGNSPNGGHYYCLIRDIGGQYILFNDDSVIENQNKELFLSKEVAQNSYLLMYSRCPKDFMQSELPRSLNDLTVETISRPQNGLLFNFIETNEIVPEEQHSVRYQFNPVPSPIETHFQQPSHVRISISVPEDTSLRAELFINLERIFNEEDVINISKYRSQLSYSTLNDSDFILIGFPRLQFEALFNLIEEYLPRNEQEKGRPTVIDERSKFFIFLYWLRTARPYTEIAYWFGIKKSTCERLIKRYTLISEKVYNKFIIWKSPEELSRDPQNCFKHFADTYYCIDSTSSEIYRPLKEGQQQFYSGKSKEHCLKAQTIHDVYGKCLDIAFDKGVVHDKKLFELSNVAEKLRYQPPNENKYANILADSGYQGIQDILQTAAIFPYKAVRSLNDFQKRLNKNLSSDRVIVENFYGRLKGLFPSMGHIKWKNRVKQWRYAFIWAASITNFDITFRPMRLNRHVSSPDT